VNWENAFWFRIFGAGVFVGFLLRKVFGGLRGFWQIETETVPKRVGSFWGFLGFLAQNMAKMPQNRLFLAIVAIETIY
jgi:hypothetical protein